MHRAVNSWHTLRRSDIFGILLVNQDRRLKRERNPVARRTNYSFEKRQREAKKKKKKAEKLEKKRMKAAGTDVAPVEGEDPAATEEEQTAVEGVETSPEQK
jgi:hypothetical protein